MRRILLLLLIVFAIMVSCSNAADQDESDGKVCAICMSAIVDGEQHVIHPIACDHEFHTGCLQPWLDRGQNTCPLCRGLVIPPPLLLVRFVIQAQSHLSTGMYWLVSSIVRFVSLFISGSLLGVQEGSAAGQQRPRRRRRGKKKKKYPASIPLCQGACILSACILSYLEMEYILLDIIDQHKLSTLVFPSLISFVLLFGDTPCTIMDIVVNQELFSPWDKGLLFLYKVNKHFLLVLALYITAGLINETTIVTGNFSRDVIILSTFMGIVVSLFCLFFYTNLFKALLLISLPIAIDNTFFGLMERYIYARKAEKFTILLGIYCAILALLQYCKSTLPSFLPISESL